FCFTVSVTVPPELGTLHNPVRVPETSGTSSDVATRAIMPKIIERTPAISSLLRWMAEAVRKRRMAIGPPVSLQALQFLTGRLGALNPFSRNWRRRFERGAPRLHRCGHPRQRASAALCARATAHPDRADQLSSHDDGISARRRDDAVERQQGKADSTRADPFLEALCRAAERRGRLRLVDRNVDRGELSVV